MDFSIIFWEFLGEPMVPKPVQVWGWVGPGFWGPGSVVEKSGPNGPLDSSTTIFCIFIAQIQTQIFS